MDDGALNDALKRGGGTGVLAAGHDEAVEIVVDEFLEIGLQGIDINIAPDQNRNRVAVIGQGQK